MKMAAIVAIFCFFACGQAANHPLQKKQKLQDSLLESKVRKFEQELYPEMERLAETADIVTRMGTDITSLMLSKINPADSSYSHCGIISVENDSVFVYHAIGGEFNPDQKMRRDWLHNFAQPVDCKRLGIFTPDLTAMQKKLLGEQVKHLHTLGIPFDMDFDLKTDNSQYCTEMVAKSIGKIIGKMDWAPIYETNGIRFIPVENIYRNKLVKEKKRFDY